MNSGRVGLCINQDSHPPFREHARYELVRVLLDRLGTTTQPCWLLCTDPIINQAAQRAKQTKQMPRPYGWSLQLCLTRRRG